MSWSLSKFPCRRWRSAVSRGWIDFARELARFVLVGPCTTAKSFRSFRGEVVLAALACSLAAALAGNREPRLGKPRSHSLPICSLVPRTLLELRQQLLIH